ncbi:MAG: hypothetical protein ABUS48_00605 [Pseudomonadota bacterium]
MRFLIAAFAATAALFSSAYADDPPSDTTTPAPATQGASPPPGCDELFVGRHWRAATEAYQAQRFDLAIPELDLVITQCGDDPSATTSHAMRAQIALIQNDNQHALDTLGDIAAPGAPLGSYGVWLKLQALIRLHRDAEVSELAHTLLAASDAAITASGFGMQKVESFDSNGYSITSYQGQFNQGPFVRYYEFLMLPDAGGLPLSIVLSKDASAAARETDYFVDLYECSGHYTLDVVTPHGAMTYAQARAGIERALSDRHAVSATTSRNGLCIFTPYITPGLD